MYFVKQYILRTYVHPYAPHHILTSVGSDFLVTVTHPFIPGPTAEPTQYLSTSTLAPASCLLAPFPHTTPTTTHCHFIDLDTRMNCSIIRSQHYIKRTLHLCATHASRPWGPGRLTFSPNQPKNKSSQAV